MHALDLHLITFELIQSENEAIIRRHWIVNGVVKKGGKPRNGKGTK